MRKTVYVSFPYRNDIKKNKKLIDKLIEALYNTYDNILFISPLHLFGYFHELDVNEFKYDDDIMLFDLKMVDICDEIWIFDYTGESVGCKYEELEGLKKNIDVKVWNKDSLEYLVGDLDG